MEHNNTSNNQGRDDSSFSLLPQCNECTFANGVGGVCGTNKLWLFFKEAHERYQTEVIGCGKLYHRYKKDFLNSHSYTDCQYAAGKNEHKKNFYIMEEFLEEREDLVVMFFTKVDFEYHDYKALHHKFNTTEPPPNGQYLHGKPPSILQTAQETKPKQDFQCYFDSTQLNLIARHANEVHLFSADVSEEDMRNSSRAKSASS